VAGWAVSCNQGHKHLTVHFGDVPHMDSAGASASLVLSYATDEPGGCQLTLLNTTPRIHDPLVITKLSTVS
jgi:anti-anti-sigma regulatory factor